ncbi:MAG: nucleotidyltransferase domain-containing protein [Acidobacteriota bacterium]
MDLILPVGTKVVTAAETRRPDGTPRPSGAVGVVVEAPFDHTHAYRVCFADGEEAAFRRRQILVLKEVQKEGADGAQPAASFADLSRFVIYRCVIGSRAYGLAGESSDYDRRGIYLPPADVQWSLFGVPEQTESDATQECYWELRKFLVLALKANPNVLECLYTPIVEHETELGEELRGLRSIFLSRLVYQTYNGYVISQFKKLEQDIRNRAGIRWKHAMHLIRLLLSGIVVMKEGVVPVRVDEHRERLLAIRRGEVPWTEVNEWRLSLNREFDAAYASTRLPARPDFDRANLFLLKARRSML